MIDETRRVLVEFLLGVVAGMRPFRKALHSCVVAIPALSITALAGVGAIWVGASLAGPWARASTLAGEALILIAVFGGAVMTIWAWWEVFRAAGFLDKVRSSRG